MAADQGLERGGIVAVEKVREQFRVGPLAKPGGPDGRPDELDRGFGSRAHGRGSGGRIVHGKDATDGPIDTLILTPRKCKSHRDGIVTVVRLFS